MDSRREHLQLFCNREGGLPRGSILPGAAKTDTEGKRGGKYPREWWGGEGGDGARGGQVGVALGVGWDEGAATSCFQREGEGVGGSRGKGSHRWGRRKGKGMSEGSGKREWETGVAREGGGCEKVGEEGGGGMLQSYTARGVWRVTGREKTNGRPKTRQRLLQLGSEHAET